MSNEGSRIFIGYRALGFVSNHVAPVTRYIRRRREHLVVTSVGRVFHTYGCSKLGLLSVSKVHPEEITCLAADSYLVYSACGNTIFAWRRGTELKHCYKGHDYAVKLLLPFGPHLISIDEQSVLKIWDIKSETLSTELEFPHKSFEISCVVHPATYMNKVLIGSAQGSLQLWNLKSCKRIYKFCGWGSGVACLEQAPAIDVIAIGLDNGDIIVHNIKVDQTIVKFSQDCGRITSLSFRTDGEPILVSGSTSGKIHLWDLEKQCLAAQMPSAHAESVSGARCLPGEPLMISASADNTLKEWIFDMGDGAGRLLKHREGHEDTPTRIRFYGSSGESILSSGLDSSLRSFSTVTDVLNKSFGVASYNRKRAKKFKAEDNPCRMEPIIDFTTDTTRDRDWANIACVHRDTLQVTTWSFGNQKMEDLKLKHPRFTEDYTLRSSKASCASLSICGNFVLIGCDSGHVDKFNIQSGIHRGAFIAKGVQDKDGAAHPGRKIRAVLTDGLNQMVLTFDDLGGLKFWSFSKRLQLHRMALEHPATRVEIQRDSGLCAVGHGVDFSLSLIDIVTRKVVRKFEGHTNQITDLAFSSDSRWIISSSMDKTIKVWDIPTGHLVDQFSFPHGAATSITMSPSGEFLATVHSGSPGIYLWANCSMYDPTKRAGRAIESGLEAKPIRMPTTSTTKAMAVGGDDALRFFGEEASKMETDEDDDSPEEDEEFVSPLQLAEDLVTLANLPGSRWQNLLILETIKSRNKPVNAVVKPSSAPFFLPTLTGADGVTRFDHEKTEEENEVKVTQMAVLELSSFAKKLLAAENEKDYQDCMATLKDLGPSAIDSELRMLDGSPELLSQFLDMILATLTARKDYEVCQAYLGLFLKVHADLVMSSAVLPDRIAKVLECQEDVLAEVKSSVNDSAALVAFYRNAVVN